MMLDSIDYKIISLIANGNYHSGQQLADTINTSRAAINKRINKINNFFEKETRNSYRIYTTVGKGYCFNQLFDVVCLEQIEKNISKEINNKLKLEFFPVIDSTNNYLINKTINGHNNFHVCLSEMQTAGRGRMTLSRHKSWCSPFGNNIYCSISWNYLGNQNSLMGLSIIAGITIIELIEFLYTQNNTNMLAIKWPNDIVINNKKVAGILTEIIGDPNGGCKVIIGFGLNIWKNYHPDLLNMIDTQIEQGWASVGEYAMLENITRNQIISGLINKFVLNYSRFMEAGLCGFLEKWEKYDILKDKVVNIETPGLIKTGVAMGIDQQGALLVEVQGERQTFYSGEVSVKLIG